MAGSIVKKKDDIPIFLLHFSLNMFTHSSIVAAVIQAFLLFLQITGKLLIFRCLKHFGFAAFPITRGVYF
jgi:hypothetical protein